VTTGRLHGRIMRMGSTGQHTRASAAASSTPAAPASAPPPANSATYAGGQNTAPYGAPQSGGLQPVDQSHPAVATPNGGSMASPPSVMVMPLAAVVIGPVQGEYVTLGAQDLTPIFTPDGAAIPATAPGRWVQLRAAGRP
jgi:hypothetical protein